MSYNMLLNPYLLHLTKSNNLKFKILITFNLIIYYFKDNGVEIKSSIDNNNRYFKGRISKDSKLGGAVLPFPRITFYLSV